MRASGTNDLGTILIAIATDLETFDFNDTFTGNFEVANKVSKFGCARLHDVLLHGTLKHVGANAPLLVAGDRASHVQRWTRSVLPRRR